jgi:hypothetical protein
MHLLRLVKITWIITEMTSAKISTQLFLRQKAIAISRITISTTAIASLCISSVATSLTFVPSAFAQYNLGLPKSAGTGGATRGILPPITILAPEDGAKTLASRPTFYWYISPDNAATTDSTTTIPKVEDDKSSSKITFFLRDSIDRSAKSIFVAEGKAKGAGLYKFTLPENAPELVKGKVQRWQIRWQQGENSSLQVDVNYPIRRDDDPATLKAIASAKNDLEKARIYAKNAYWYDAIDAYSNWLSKNPKDDVALTERSNLLKAGLSSSSAFTKRDEQGKLILPEELDPTKLSDFLTKIDASKSAASIVLTPKVVTK